MFFHLAFIELYNIILLFSLIYLRNLLYNIVKYVSKKEVSMNINTTYTKIITDEDLMETIQHGSNLYPFQFYYEDLSVFDFNCIEWHWHTELEFIYIESGTVTLWIGEDQFNLTEGNGIFINTKVLHRLYSPSKALIPNFVFMPSFIAPCDSLIYQKYILPIISYPLPFLIFHKEVC